MAAAEEIEPGTVYCCEAVWTDRLGERRSIVVLPRDGVAAVSYARQRLREVGRMEGDPYMWGWGFHQNPDDPAVRRRAEARRKAEKDVEARNVRLSRGVPVTMPAAVAGACAGAADAMLAVVDHTDAEWATAGVRAARRWNALFAEQIRKRARRRYREAMDAAAQQYAEAVGDLPARVRAEVVRAEQADRQRQYEAEAEIRRRRSARQKAVTAVDQRQVWMLFVSGDTAYVKRSDVAPTSKLPPAGRRWSERLQPFDLSLRIAGLLYQRAMVAPKARKLVFDDAAVEATRRELQAGGVDADEWWNEHYRRAEAWVSDRESSRRRGGYSSGGFI